MRLNEKTYPAYIALEKGKFLQLQIDQLFSKIIKDNDEFLRFISLINEVYKRCQNRYYLTNPFKDAIIAAAPKLKEVIIKGDDTNDCGIIFTDKGFTLYMLNNSLEEIAGQKFRFIAFGFTREVLTTYAKINADNSIEGVACMLQNGVPYNNIDYRNEYAVSTILAVNFINHCEIETKILKPKEKHRASGHKFFNESTKNITILDCGWFTELIRNTPFSVRGHLRWQPYGAGKNQKKLIWIEDFQKQGYHRKPQKTIINTNNTYNEQ